MYWAALRRTDRRKPRFVRLLAMLLLVSGCTGPEQDWYRTFDLVSSLATAELSQELSAIDFSSPQDRLPLRGGWSRNEHDPRRDRNFAWGLGDRSAVGFPLVALRELEVTLEGRSYVLDENDRQLVSLRVNGEPLIEIEFSRRLQTRSVVIPPEHLVIGENLLQLEYSVSRSPRQLGRSNDPRQLAVAWYSIAFDREVPPAPPSVAEERLLVPAGTELTFFLDPPRGSEFRVERWYPADQGSATAEVEVLEENRAVRSVGRLSNARGRLARFPLRLTTSGSGPIGLRLRVIAEDGDQTPPTLVLESPRVWSPGEPPQTRSGVARPGDTESVQRRPNIVFYLVDTLRADRLGCYGNQRAVTPHIDAFAEDAAVFEFGASQSSWTKSSVASIMTGLWPGDHRTNHRKDRLGDEAVTLPERLTALGYRTAAFVTNPNVNTNFGFGQGFDHFDYLGEKATSDQVAAVVAQWLDAFQDSGREDEDSQPFFLYVHTIDPHAPYSPPETFRRLVAGGVDDQTVANSQRLLDDVQAGRVPPTEQLLGDLLSLYDAEVTANDAGFGQLIEDLKRRSLFEETVIVFVSDHGEEFREHGNFQHGRSLHRESIHVPLILRLPGGGGRRITSTWQHVDLAPTLLDWLGAELDPHAEGVSLLPWILESEPGTDSKVAPRPVFPFLHLDGSERPAVILGEWKLLQEVRDGKLVWPRLYNLVDDPFELRDLAAELPIRTAFLNSLIRARRADDSQRLSSQEAELDAQTIDGLRALGYLD